MNQKSSINNNNKVIAVAKYIRSSQNKVGRVLKQIKGKNYDTAILILEFMPYRSCKNIKKLLHSAGSNAENNYGFKKSELYIKAAFVNQGPTIKRFQARAQGRAFPIHKPTCHITLNLQKK
jgi:large subunit ribosomal protein L22|uniref:Large ribosomal subunit protein uL22c n=1 Tax=Thorea hispida TaxID=202687 RepID=A0A1C9CAR2_9FLOR|nr:ribosomal protein L22 [Thorea hispida]AOM65480.1 ribosomal protein L22 [Thorea hispida]ARX95849.1 50S ribosomal protein L22 [Thorea hispida]UNJ79134.1 ribosomal protein L22 [Thorea hispida]